MDSSTNGIPLDSADGYRTDVQWATRLTNSGIYVHAAPWSVGSQGSANVSHGCVNVSDEWGKWFFDLSQPGDVVTITGGPRPPSSTDAGSRDWNMSWDEWIAGSALAGLPIELTAPARRRPVNASPASTGATRSRSDPLRGSTGSTVTPP